MTYILMYDSIEIFNIFFDALILLNIKACKIII